MKIIACLGNPGEKYSKSRHNAAWIFIDKQLPGATWQENKRFNSLVYKDAGVIYVKPLVYMNKSGESVKRILDYYKLLPKKLSLFPKKDQDLGGVLTVIHDDLDIEIGKYKISKNSSSAGHRGVDSIIGHLKTKDFSRLRLGIKNDLLRKKIPASNFVLQNFGSDELNIIGEIAGNIDLNDIL